METTSQKNQQASGFGQAGFCMPQYARKGAAPKAYLGSGALSAFLINAPDRDQRDFFSQDFAESFQFGFGIAGKSRMDDAV